MTPTEVQAYADGFQRRTNREAWLQGIYTQDALTSIASAILSGKNRRNTYEYPKQPHGELQPQRVEEKRLSQEQEELLAELYMRQMVEAGKNWGKNQPAAFSEEEMQKKRAQVRGLQAALISQQQGGE